MKIVVIGGTGLIGSKVVEHLAEHGHEAIAASPNSGVNTITGEGLAEVLAGANVVVDVSNSPSFADDDVLEFFTTSTNNLLAAEREAGVTPPRRAVGRRRRPPAEQRLPAREGRAGAAHRGVGPAVLDRAGDPVLRVRRAHRRRGHRRRHRTAQHGADAADRGRGCLGRRRPRRRRRTRSTAPSRSADPSASARTSSSAPRLTAKGDPRTVVGDPEAHYFGTPAHGHRTRARPRRAALDDDVRRLAGRAVGPAGAVSRTTASSRAPIRCGRGGDAA